MVVNRPVIPEDGMETFSSDMEAHHLAQILASKYEKDPAMLGRHYEMNFTALPAMDAHGDDPARVSKVMLVSWKPQHGIPNFGNVLIPENIKGTTVISVKTLYKSTF